MTAGKSFAVIEFYVKGSTGEAYLGVFVDWTLGQDDRWGIDLKDAVDGFISLID